MAIKVLMPALSPTMKEGNLVKWLKKEGDKVSCGDIIAEIETDKATMEVESVDDGILAKILVSQGTANVAVNTLIAVLKESGDSDEDVASLSQEAPSETKGNDDESKSKQTDAPEKKSVPANDAPKAIPKEVTATTSPSSERIFISPLARRIAVMNNVDISAITGTGPKGRIVCADIENHIQSGGDVKTASNMKISPAPKAKSMEQCDLRIGVHNIKHDTDINDSADSGLTPSYRHLPLANMRKVIAARLCESKQNIPHFYLTVNICLDNLLLNRQQLNDQFKEYGIKVSINDFITKAVSHSLMSVPEVNAAWFDDHIRQYTSADVAIAVAIEGGLITPIVRSCHRKSLVEISQEIKQLVQLAKSGSLSPEQFQGGTFSISNMGMLGIDQFCAVINPPQSAILAVGAMQNNLVLNNEGIPKEQKVMNLTLSVDHRVIDGAVAAKFMAVLKKYLESPILLIA